MKRVLRKYLTLKHLGKVGANFVLDNIFDVIKGTRKRDARGFQRVLREGRYEEQLRLLELVTEEENDGMVELLFKKVSDFENLKFDVSEECFVRLVLYDNLSIKNLVQTEEKCIRALESIRRDSVIRVFKGIENKTDAIIRKAIEMRPGIVHICRLTIYKREYLELAIKMDPNIISNSVSGNGHMQTLEMCELAVKERVKRKEVGDGDKFLSKIRVKFRTRGICEQLVSFNGFNLRYVPEEHFDEGMKLLAVRQNPWVLKIIDEQSEELCLAAVELDGESILYAKVQTEQVCRVAVRQSFKALLNIRNEAIVKRLAEMFLNS